MVSHFLEPLNKLICCHIQLLLPSQKQLWILPSGSQSTIFRGGKILWFVFFFLNVIQHGPGSPKLRKPLKDACFFDYWTCFSVTTGLICLIEVRTEAFTLGVGSNWCFNCILPWIKIRKVPHFKEGCEIWLISVFVLIFPHCYRAVFGKLGPVSWKWNLAGKIF